MIESLTRYWAHVLITSDQLNNATLSGCGWKSFLAHEIKMENNNQNLKLFFSLEL